MKLWVYCSGGVMPSDPRKWGNEAYDLYLAEDREQALKLVRADRDAPPGISWVYPELLVKVDMSHPCRLAEVFEKDYSGEDA